MLTFSNGTKYIHMTHRSLLSVVLMRCGAWEESKISVWLSSSGSVERGSPKALDFLCCLCDYLENWLCGEHVSATYICIPRAFLCQTRVSDLKGLTVVNQRKWPFMYERLVKEVRYIRYYSLLAL